MKGDAVNLSKWLQALTSFIGQFYKKVHGVMPLLCAWPTAVGFQFFTAELRGILHFVAIRVSKHSIADLVVVKELVQRMGSIENPLDVSDSQV